MLQAAGDAQSNAARLAQQALRQDPTAVKALNVLGIQAQLRNDSEDARRIFAYSLDLSRRELPARMWAIEEAVSRGDIREALVNYDIALTTSKQAPGVLFPVLAAAIDEPRVRAALVEKMAHGTAWGQAFLHYAAASGSKPRATSELLRAVASVGVPVEDGDRARVVDTLFNQGMEADAWQYYASFREGAQRTRSRAATFAVSSDTPAVFDWQTVDVPGITASIQSGEDGGILHFFIAPSASGVLLRQFQALPPGSYRLDGRSSDLPSGEQMLPYWTIACKDGREIGRIPLEASRSGRFFGRFTIPQGCNWQVLALNARSSGRASGLSGQIERAAISPIANERQGLN